MENILAKIKNLFFKLEGTISFYPIIISFLGFCFALFMLYLEGLGISYKLAQYVPQIVIDNASTSRTLMSFLTGGIISIMVFSFSLVMILLNQASNNFSPRVLPGLISNKKHQYIIGLYLSVIVYNTFITIGISPKEGEKYTIPGISILVGITLTMLCFIAFIYFIHSISQSIQVNYILENLNKKGKKMLNILRPLDEEYKDFDTHNEWQTFNSDQTGYYQKINTEVLLDICNKNNLKIKLLPIQGFFIIKNTPLFQVDKTIDKNIEKCIRENIVFSKDELAEENYIFAFKQIAEIGIKAMSPGINDPITAVSTIDYLTELFLIRLEKNDRFFILNEQNQPTIELYSVDFSDLLYQILVSYRTYCKQDMTCTQKLFIMLGSLAKKTENNEYLKTIHQEIENLYEDTSSSVKNKQDLAVINTMYSKFKD